MQDPVTWYVICLLVMSLAAFAAFAVDKKRSKRENSRRVPEIALLSLVGFGGAAGGFLGMYLLRHKTNLATKFHFAATTWVSGAAQLLLLLYLIAQKGAIR